jgi:hypothetical protein
MEELDQLELPRNSLRIKHPYTGEVGYRAALEVFHQLHCLNQLRKVAYREYYESYNAYSGEVKGGEDLSGQVGKFFLAG